MAIARALITGIRGQDARYLTLLLHSRGVEVVGTTRDLNNTYARSGQSTPEGLTIVEWDLCDQEAFARLLHAHAPDVVFNFAGLSSGAEMNTDPDAIARINGLSVLNMLEAIRCFAPDTKFIQASSAEIFGITNSPPQSELSCRWPRSAYGVAKVFADGMVKHYRVHCGLFCASAILYNHESPLRGKNFVTRKISSTVAAIKRGVADRILLGDLSARRDWGHARDYVDGMWLMAQAETADDYVFATGEARSVRNFVEVAFRHIGIELRWSGLGLDEVGVCRQSGAVRVAISPDFFRPSEGEQLVGDARKARAMLGWTPSVTFEELVEEMVDADVSALESQDIDPT